MANKSVFGSSTSELTVPKATTTNKSGGIAYEYGPQHALAQLAVTGTFNDTFYGKAVEQLEAVKIAADQVSPEFLAKCAVYAREKGGMKDMPSALMVMLSKADRELFEVAFPRTIDNAKQVKNLVQMTRSGAFGRKSVKGTMLRLVRNWITSRTARTLFRASVGKDGASLADVIKLTHVKPKDAEQKALLGYILGKDYDADALPEIVKQFEAFKKGERKDIPEGIEFRMLTSLPLTQAQWAQIALAGGWHQTRINLKAYAGKGVFNVKGVADKIAAKLKDRDEIVKARCFPYQLMVAYRMAAGAMRSRYAYTFGAPKTVEVEVPTVVTEALQDAMEIAVENVPTFGVQTHVIVDVSGSMHSAITGSRKGGTSVVSCVDVAGLMGACVLRRNPGSTVLPVDTRVHGALTNPRDSVITNAEKLASKGGGGTELSAAMRHINSKGLKGGLIIVVSDNMSWRETTSGRDRYYGGATGLMGEFRKFQGKNPGAKLVCIDLQTYGTTQAPCEPGSVMNIGGFSDTIWTTIERFVGGDSTSADVDAWVAEIESINLAPETASG